MKRLLFLIVNFFLLSWDSSVTISLNKLSIIFTSTQLLSSVFLVLSFKQIPEILRVLVKFIYNVFLFTCLNCLNVLVHPWYFLISSIDLPCFHSTSYLIGWLISLICCSYKFIALLNFDPCCYFKYMWMLSLCACLCFWCMLYACEGRHQIPRNWNYRWLWYVMWVVRLNSTPLGKQLVL